ncbi:hypothetical protein LTR78_005944 [Recurvomyces mirabilis]|uniref:Uncharacterized protein n=1 Tax=Recurvomyces mirabilis TaxID=574656 RepID=A0AAE0WLW1_9PEZI|nr:hypothetical protein LTR78_005944 [Recurvomyces mirabilis]KAK5155246.1 hypothetical protein LTS14_006201 [Recurvomyces mirabilis]
MPTYHAVGITVSLAVADLKATCSNVVDKRMGPKQREDADRIYDIFSHGRTLTESPIGVDGSTKGVMQFIGTNDDLPFFLVEAGDGVLSVPAIDPQLMATQDKASKTEPDTDDSPLTSLGATPTNANVSLSNIQHSVATSLPVSAKERGKKAQNNEHDKSLTFASFDRARGLLDAPNGPKALSLTVQISDRSYLPTTTERGRNVSQDLKVEIFLNGQLVGLSFINPRGAAVELKNDRVRYHGTRVHRQLEKPWIYDNAREGESAEVRWDNVSRKLDDEAQARGHNRWGDFSASAEFLLALSQRELPERLRGNNGIAIIDIIITAGNGRKYGPDTSYIRVPTRMDDSTHAAAHGEPRVDELEDADTLFGIRLPTRSPYQSFASAVQPHVTLPQSSPEVPLMRQRSAALLPQTPTKRKQKVDLGDLTLDGIDLDAKVSPFENSRRKAGQQRNLRQRLRDISQMNAKNKAKALEALSEELDEDQLELVKKTFAEDIDEDMEPSPSKRARLDPSCGLTLDHQYGLNMLADAAMSQDGTLNSMQLWRSTPAPRVQHPADPFTANIDYDAEARLTQDRMNMALEAGAGFSGPLMRHLAATSPRSTPEKRTNAGSLAKSPCKVPVKATPRNKAVKTPTPQRSTYRPDEFGSPIPIDPVLTASARQRATPQRRNKDESPSKKFGLGSDRTRKAWYPNEISADQAFEDFEIPDLCKGSVVTYSEDLEMKRQIGKARGGEFLEKSVVVGMRFVVV